MSNSLLTEQEFIEQASKMLPIDAMIYARDIHLFIANQKRSYGGSKKWHRAWANIYNKVIEKLS